MSQALVRDLNRRSFIDRPGQPFPRQSVEVDGVEIAYARQDGGGPTVVLVHGTLTALDDMMLALGGVLTGYRIIAFDRPGFGLTTRRAGRDAGVLAQARLLNLALDALGVERAALVGHSFGGPVALAMALGAPGRAAGVVALAPLVIPELRLEHLVFGPRGAPVAGGWLSGWSHASSDRTLLPVLWRAMFLPQAMPGHVETMFPFALAGEAGATRRVAEDCLAAGPDLLGLLAQVTRLQAPLKVMGGSADLVVNNLLHGQLLASLAPRGSFDLLLGVGHMLHHVAPATVAATVDEVLRP